MNVKLLKELREISGLSLSLCKEALEKSNWNIEDAKIILRSMGEDIVEESKDEPVPNGLVECYVHHNKQVASIVEIRCQTDFAARVLGNFAKAICMQVAATNPEFIAERDVPKKRINAEKLKILEELESQGKQEEAVGAIIKSKMRKFYIEHCLMSQKSVHNSLITVRELLNEKIKQLGEKITIIRFHRYQVGN